MPNITGVPNNYANITVRIDNDSNNYGMHSWAGANSVFYNIQANAMFAQDPPGAHNWMIGGIFLAEPSAKV